MAYLGAAIFAVVGIVMFVRSLRRVGLSEQARSATRTTGFITVAVAMIELFVAFGFGSNADTGALVVAGAAAVLIALAGTHLVEVSGSAPASR